MKALESMAAVKDRGHYVWPILGAGVTETYPDIVPRLPCPWTQWPDFYVIDGAHYKWSRQTFLFGGRWYYQMWLYKNNLLIAVVTCKLILQYAKEN